MVPLVLDQALAADQAHKNCYCRANDKKYEQGQVLCLRGKLARCEMNLNNPSWKIIAQTCPESRFSSSSTLLAQSLIPAK